MKLANERIIIQEAEYLLEHKATVRQAASYFGRSKSTIHSDMRKTLPHINKGLANEVNHLLSVNLAERHLRGGEATKEKYLQYKH